MLEIPAASQIEMAKLSLMSMVNHDQLDAKKKRCVKRKTRLRCAPGRAYA